MNIQELKKKSEESLLSFAESLEIKKTENLSKREIVFAILKKQVAQGVSNSGGGTLEILQDGFGFLRSSQSSYLPGPDDIYVSPTQVRKMGLKTGDMIEGEILAPKEGERYFSLVRPTSINLEPPENAVNRINFEDLTPLHPDEKLNLENLSHLR